MNAFSVGDFARSLESGWLGKIVEIAPDQDGTPTAKMIGVDILGTQIMGLSREESLSHDDVQWFALADLLPAE
jgi:hypothetical protein